MEIRYVSHSIANRFENHIEINENLKDYPELLEPILAHEFEHDEGTATWKDFKLDFFSDNKINHWQLIKFMFKHPKSFYQLLPVSYSKEKGFIYDINLLIMFLTMFIVFSLTIYFGGKNL